MHSAKSSRSLNELVVSPSEIDTVPAFSSKSMPDGSEASQTVNPENPEQYDLVDLFWTWWANPKVEISIILVSVLVAVLTPGVFDDYRTRSTQFASNHQESEVPVQARAGGIVKSISIMDQQAVSPKQVLLTLAIEGSDGLQEEVLAPSAGVVKRLKVHIGQRVKSGEIVASLER